MFGTDGKDVLFGTPGDDRLYGYGGADIFYHSAGNDHYDGGSGTGGAGGVDYDILSYLFSDKGVTVDARNGLGVTKVRGTTEQDTFTGIEKIVGSSHDDVIYAGATTDVDGANGDDWIFSGQGANVLNGGFGNDTVSYANSTGKVMVNLSEDDGAGFANHGWATGDLLYGFENVWGSAHGDNLTGNHVANSLWGGNGDDFLYGGGGDDMLYGGNHSDELHGDDGHDRLFGGSGNNTLYGGDGNDRLVGGAGGDTLTGGAGADHFIYESTLEYTGLATGTEVIKDFSRADGDKIDLSAIDANVHLAGNQMFSPFLMTDYLSPGLWPQFKAGTIAVTRFNGDTYIAVNTDDSVGVTGYDAPELQILLKGHHDLAWSDFIL